MKQILQDLSNGDTLLSSVPAPIADGRNLLIKTSTSLVSAGTERMLVDFGKANFIQKARSQPEKVQMVLDKVVNDGLVATYDAVKSKLNQPIPLGYCNVGRVVDAGVSTVEVGTRVISNGPHAEIVKVPKNLIARIPDCVDDETAAFTVLGSIALQGVRLAKPTIGETFVVTGLGLIGLLTVQILKANGCRVLGIDNDTKRCELARSFGAEIVDLAKEQDPLIVAATYSRGRGVDGVLITASSKNSAIMHQAATMCRKRGRIILVGVVGLELRRSDFYEKELTFQVSCSYGPGRYDENYEVKGNDYPVGFVRWTEQRNFEAVLDLMAAGTLKTNDLVTHRYMLDDARLAYEKLTERSTLGVLIDYGICKEEKPFAPTISLNDRAKGASGSNVSFVGAGNYASRVLIPAFRKTGVSFTSIITNGGVNSSYHGAKNGFLRASTDFDEALSHDTDAVVIATQHNLHAEQVVAALRAGKHVFVEKPLALKHSELDAVRAAYSVSNRIIMVGYNRRFAPHIQKMKSLLSMTTAPKTFVMTMNAGHISATHWTQDVNVGGGRIIGEACHYIDLMRFLANADIISHHVQSMGNHPDVEVTEDKAIITLSFSDGSIGVINYFANGGKVFAKERIEVFCDDAVLQLDNFRKLRGYGWKGFRKMNLWSQNKGQLACVQAFMGSIRNNLPSPISPDEIFEVSRVAIDVADQIRQ